jgi:C-methyltransferase C-terminal domain/Putative zinc binding domain/Methyltransferase domain
MTTSCRACAGAQLETILDLGPMPLAGGFLDGPEAIARERMYPLTIHACADCGLVQIVNPVDPDILFQDYSFSSSTIQPLVKHFEDYAEWMIARLHPSTVVEFGSNDGVLLTPLQRTGVKAIGVDISRNITALAQAKGLTAVAGIFNEETARQILNEHGPADVVTGSNAFAHNDMPVHILKAADIVLRDTGCLCLEVMYAGDLLEQLQWDTLYHEHLNFYSLATLGRLLARHGFHIVDAMRLPMHGGSLRVVAARRPAPLSASAEDLLAHEESIRLNGLQTWRDFGSRSLQKIRIVADVFDALSRRHSISAYGAAGKATMWVNAAKMHYLRAVVDASPLRAGKIMPGTHTPIVFPDAFRANPPDYMFVTAWNYADVIRSKETWFQGVWSTPLPDLRFF